jgi:Ca2+-binding EF-hand superfamily protein
MASFNSDYLLNGFTWALLRFFLYIRFKLAQADTKKQGKLDLEETLKVVQSHNPAMKDTEIKAIFEQFDKDKSGFLTLDEFIVLGFHTFLQ